MSELRNRGPDRLREQPATTVRPDTPQRRGQETPRSGAERLRALYADRSRVSRHGDSLQRGGSGGDGRTGRTDAPGRLEIASANGSRDARGRNAQDQVAVDPRLLAGVPRPRGALPDDIGRAYTRDGSPSAGGDDGIHSVRAADEDQATAQDRWRDGDRGDRLHAWVDRPAFQDRFAKMRPPDRYGDPLRLVDGSRVPRFNDRPTREQTQQGRLRDCGIIATLGAVASHRPGDIAHRVAIHRDGTYRVRLNEARCTEHGAEPTGRAVELSVTPDLPILDEAPNQPAFAKAEGGAAWSPVLEKAIAGVDQTWTATRRASWAESWAAACRADIVDKKENPRSGPPPDGYVRLNQGSTAWDRAELLTQLTGKESIVRSLPRRADEVTRVLAKQLDDRKPVLIASRRERHDDERLPHDLQAAHAYEVVAVNSQKIALRNPWNEDDPETMSAAEFAANMEPYYTTVE